MLNYLCTIVCREISPFWVNLRDEQRLAGELPPQSDGNGWAAFLAAFCQRHMQLNASQAVVIARRAAAQRANITEGMSLEDVQAWMTTAQTVAPLPAVASEIVDHTTTGAGANDVANTAAQPADPPGDSPNLLIRMYLVSK